MSRTPASSRRRPMFASSGGASHQKSNLLNDELLALLENSTGMTSNTTGNPLPELHESAEAVATPRVVRAAFEFLDPEGTGKLEVGPLRHKLGHFVRTITGSDLKYLIPEQEISLKSLQTLMKRSLVDSLDPVLEAFQVFDPQGKGYIASDTIRNLFAEIGVGELDSEDLRAVLAVSDMDNDGRISLQDFRLMLGNAEESTSADTHDSCRQQCSEDSIGVQDH